MSKRMFFVFRLLALPLWAVGAISSVQAQYVCAQGSLHQVFDLKGGDLASHQTGGNPAYTCYAAYKPAGSNGHWSCTAGSLHLVSDLKGGVLPQHQVGNPAYTCIQGSLPQCAAGFIATGTGETGGPQLSPGGTCYASPYGPPYTCASCNDGSCQCGNNTANALCTNHGGNNPSLGCTQEDYRAAPRR
jgi:hypothetical protein